jgi:hypothetical protein
LLVKRHSTPTNPYFPCPLFTICDFPAMSKFCMEPSTQPPCTTLTIPKPIPLAMDDPPVFALALNRVPEPVDISRPFDVTVPLDDSELWVLGRRIEQPEAVCQFDGVALRINDVVVPLRPEPSQPTDAELRWMYRDVPFVQLKLTEGRTRAEARALFWAELDALIQRARRAYALGLRQQVRSLFENSPLIETCEIDENTGTYIIKKRGWKGRTVGKLTVDAPVAPEPREQVRLEEKAWAIVDAIQASGSGKLIFVTLGAVFSFGCSDRAAAQAQIAHVMAGGSLDNLPPGPLRKGQAPLTYIVKVLEESR